MNYYPAPIDPLADEELQRLVKEIEDSGVLAEDNWFYDPESWEAQAYQRWSDIHQELRRRHPERYAPLDPCFARVIDTCLKHAAERLPETFERNQVVFERLRRT